MALFSRRPKQTGDADTPADVAASEDSAAQSAEPDETPAEPVPQVSISVSSYDGLGTGARRAPAAAPAPTPPALRPGAPASPAGSALQTALRTAAAEAPPAETVGGLPENVLLREAVTAFAEQPDPARLMHVARQLLQGPVYLRVQGDARALLTEGRDLPFAVANRDDKQYVVLFSGGRALASAMRSDQATDTTALGQPALAVLRQLLSGSYAGVVLDSWAGRTSPVLPRTLLQNALDQADPDATIKTLLAGVRTPATAAAVAAALADKRAWIAVNRTPDSEAWGVGESRSSDGARHLNVFSHPLEVEALGRGDKAAPITPPQLAAALAGDQALAGVIVDPAGPWIRLGRDDLAPVLARAAAS